MIVLDAGTKYIHNYLIPIGDEFCLIDTGYKWGYEAFMKRLKKINVRPESIKYIFITHMHADHIGFLKEYLSHYSPTLIYDVDDKKRLEAGKNDLNTFISTFLFLVTSKITAGALMVNKMQICPAVFYDKFIDAKKQPLLEYGVRFISLQGHTEHDTVLLYDGKCYCGDLCGSGVCGSHKFPMWLKDKYELLRSWDKIIGLDGISEICPSHGDSFKIGELAVEKEYWLQKGVFRLFKKNKSLV